MRPQATESTDNAPLTSALIGFGALTLTSGALWAITASLGGAGILNDPAGWLRTLDDSAALEAVSNAAEVVAAVLAIAITVVAIVVELAANRYSHLITRLFITEPVNQSVLGLFIITTIQCVWTAVTFNYGDAGAVLPHAGFLITLSLVTISLLALLPYIYFVFTFLSPISVIERICANGLDAIKSAEHRKVGSAQRMVQSAIDELQDVSRGAIEQGDRSIAMTAVNGLSALVYDYAGIRHKLPDAWFEISDGVLRDADFVALTPDSIATIEQQKIWLETKIFRQLLSLMSQCAGNAREVANLIGINTGRIAKDLGGDNPELTTLCMRAFNSYLRATINARDLRTAYYIMDQYRDLAEHLLELQEDDLVLEIAGFFREYGQVAHRAGLSFLLDAAAYDVVQLIERAVACDSGIADQLLSILLELDQEIKEESEEVSLLGVRRSQIQLATLFLLLGQEGRVQRLVDDLKGERIARLTRLREGLEEEDRPQFWELTDRGSNFAYLPPERKIFLAPLFERLQSS